MKKQLRVVLSLLAIFVCSSSLLKAGPTVIWDSSIPVFADVVDCDIDVQGMVELNMGIKVIANAADILITVTNGDAVITGPSTPYASCVPPRLYLIVQNDHTITFSLADDLMFRGTICDEIVLDLLVSVSGDGVVIFNIGDDQKVTFTSEPNSGVTHVFLVMHDVNAIGTAPELRFQRMPGPSASSVEFGPGCEMTFLAGPCEVGPVQPPEGTIVIDAANSSAGRLNLRMDDNTAVITGAHFVSDVGIEYLLSDINFLLQPDGFPTMRVQGSGPQIINGNTILTDYRFDPWCNDPLSTDTTRHGFIVDSNGSLDVADGSFLEYTGLANNDCPTPDIDPALLNGQTVAEVVKPRNPSAFIADHNRTNTAAANPQLRLLGTSAAYFRSGVDSLGTVTIDFLVDPENLTEGAGEIVLDVEGALDVCGTVSDSKIEILSLSVDPTGGTVLVGGTGPPDFPTRNFNTDSNGDLTRYNKAAFFINGRLNLGMTTLVHTDVNHDVFEKDFEPSEPTYIGGDTFSLKLSDTCFGQRPKIVFGNSEFRVHSDVALAGVDLFVPNPFGAPQGCDLFAMFNTVEFTFYHSGRIVDVGGGRHMILGATIGSLSCAETVVDREAHLDVYQETEQSAPPAGSHRLTLRTDVNDSTIDSAIPVMADLSGQCLLHTLYINHASNISLGTQATVGTTFDCTSTFALTTSPKLLIGGDFFSFETRGGSKGFPEASGITGEGGIFVQNNGCFSIEDFRRANISAMVVLIGDGTVNLPKRQVFFDSRIGITRFQVDLGTALDRLLVGPNQCISDLTLDWVSTQKDFAAGFVPYEIKQTPTICDCPVVTHANLINLPEVQGELDQLQIKRSRIADQAHFKVNGGFVRELVFLSGFDSAEAPVGFAVIENEGRLGIGSAHRNVDSVEATVKLGNNGLSLIPNGSGTVELNEDVLIDNVCHILTGTLFGLNEEDRLLIRSNTRRKLIVKGTGVLDLSQFTSTQQVLEIGGEVRLVFEPGARLVLGGGILRFTDQSELELKRIVDRNELAGTSLADNNDVRVVFAGTGSIVMQEAATAFIHQNAQLGIETLPDCGVMDTNLTWTLRNQAKIFIGNSATPGGSFFVGNPETRNGTVDFSIILDGIGTLLHIDRQGLLGWGVGMVDESSTVPNNWTVGALVETGTICLNIIEGAFDHNQILSGDDDRASLFAINDGGFFSFLFDPVNSKIRGGGNLALISSTTTGINPTVLAVTSPTLINDVAPGIMASKFLLEDTNNPVMPAVGTGLQLFNFLQTISYPTQLTSVGPVVGLVTMHAAKANLGKTNLGESVAGYVFNTAIRRQAVDRILGNGLAAGIDHVRSLDIAAVAVDVHPTTLVTDHFTEIPE